MSFWLVLLLLIWGHILSYKGLHVDPKKITAILSWPLPTSLKEVQVFLGLTGYYRHFVKGAQLASPLTDLLKKDSFIWTELTSAAFFNLNRL